MRVVNRIEFTAKDDAEAMRLAAERLGKDAVILSTQMVKEGGLMGFFQRTVLKVTAGILEDDARESQQKPKAKVKDPRGDEDTRRETLIGFQKLLELKDRTSKGRGPLPSEGRPLTPARGQSTPLAITPTGGEGYIPTAADSPDGDTVRISSEGLRSAYGLSGPAPKPHVAPPAPSLPVAASALPVPPAPQQDETRALKEQVGALAQRVDSLLERLVVAESGGSAAEFPMAGPQRAVQPQGPAFQAGLPAQDAVLPASRLNERGLADRLRSSEVDEKYIRKLLADYGVTDRRMPFTEWLGSRIVCAGDDGGDASGGRKVMLLGPTGVGKTTTIAKLAAIQALWEHKKVLLLTSDTYRIAAVDQLKTYAKILNVPIEIVFDSDSIPSLLMEHENADIVLLDTAGRAQRDKKSVEIFESLYDAFIPDAVHLCLAANMKYKDMIDVVEHIPNIPVSHLIFTKLDETISYGAIFNIQQVMGCPVSFLTAGQNVPKDIETASGSRIAEFLMMSEEERKRG
ncbi:MAG: hypothetical protein IJU98_12360 [Synergistaceae bacterium]|nr:hypothetical protein [Synergistaceae bacterium]